MGCCAGKSSGLLRPKDSPTDLLQLAPGHQAAAEGDPADHDREQNGHRTQWVLQRLAMVGLPAHQQAGSSAKAVEQRHQLRHLGELQAGCRQGSYG